MILKQGDYHGLSKWGQHITRILKSEEGGRRVGQGYNVSNTIPDVAGFEDGGKEPCGKKYKQFL